MVSYLAVKNSFWIFTIYFVSYNISHFFWKHRKEKWTWQKLPLTWHHLWQEDKIKTITEQRTVRGKTFWELGKKHQHAAVARSVGRSNERDASEGKHHTAAGGRTRSWQPIMYKVQFQLTKTIYISSAQLCGKDTAVIKTVSNNFHCFKPRKPQTPEIIQVPDSSVKYADLLLYLRHIEVNLKFFLNWRCWNFSSGLRSIDAECDIQMKSTLSKCCFFFLLLKKMSVLFVQAIKHCHEPFAVNYTTVAGFPPDFPEYHSCEN